MKRIGAVVLLCSTLFGYATITFAETTKFKQQILPIDCIYEVIDVGTQKLRYLTPETCPIDPGPPVITNPSTPDTSLLSTDNVSSVNWVYEPPVQTIQPQVTPEDDESNDDGTVQGEVGIIKDIIYKNQDAFALACMLVFLWWLIVLVRRDHPRG